ncbi:MAG: glutaredoxin family protein [Halieaceae bacterium]|jgi:glutaredoxin|uniref:MauE/DoxX family redox-associated membrane protein n=1 Tax=Haliea alexandrii TaxID=2448162 RepID=UPI000F0BCBA4|nr:MauE/DoxX family redox-associated membrane protein [Haliea alexandrii]MCR9186835.1 glutaredoxin family protein [Halieaceae bacterium]
MSKQATLYRMETADHLCPFGLKSRDLLRRQGYDLNDRVLGSREEADAFKREHGVETTPQVFIAGERIGGYEALRAHLGLEQEGDSGTTYKPVIAIFGACALAALALVWGRSGALDWSALLATFIGLSMVVLAIQKLQDLTAFSNQFVTYDLLSMRYVPYAYVYPFAEAYAGFGMLAGVLPWAFAPVSLFIGTVGAVSVFKAVYIEKRELKCACVGGDSQVPLGFVSLTENVFMIFAGVWMLVGM